MTSYSVTSPAGITSSIRMEPELNTASFAGPTARIIDLAISSVMRVGWFRTLASVPSRSSVVLVTTLTGSNPWLRKSAKAAFTHRSTRSAASGSSESSSVMPRSWAEWDNALFSRS